MNNDTRPLTDLDPSIVKYHAERFNATHNECEFALALDWIDTYNMLVACTNPEFSECVRLANPLGYMFCPRADGYSGC